MRRLLLPVVLLLALSACDDKKISPPPFTPATPTGTPHTPTPEPSTPRAATPTKKPGPVQKWVRGKLTVEVLDAPDPDFPTMYPGLAQVIFTCGYAPKSTQWTVSTSLNQPQMNKERANGDYVNGPAFTALVASFYSESTPQPDYFSRDSWPVPIPQEDSGPLPEISTAYQVTRDKLTAASIVKVRAVYTAGCMSDLNPGLPADVEIWAPWDWQFELPEK